MLKYTKILWPWFFSAAWWLADHLYGDKIFAWLRPKIPHAISDPNLSLLLTWGVPLLFVVIGTVIAARANRHAPDMLTGTDAVGGDRARLLEATRRMLVASEKMHQTFQIAPQDRGQAIHAEWEASSAEFREAADSFILDKKIPPLAKGALYQCGLLATSYDKPTRRWPFIKARVACNRLIRKLNA